MIATITHASKRTYASRQADYRRAKASREFAGSFLGGIMDVSALRLVQAKELEAMAKYNYSSVTFNASVTNHFYDSVIYLTANDGTYSVLEMLALWEESLKSV